MKFLLLVCLFGSAFCDPYGAPALNNQPGPQTALRIDAPASFLPTDVKPAIAAAGHRCPNQPLQVLPPVQRPECNWREVRDPATECVTEYICDLKAGAAPAPGAPAPVVPAAAAAPAQWTAPVAAAPAQWAAPVAAAPAQWAAPVAAAPAQWAAPVPAPVAAQVQDAPATFFPRPVPALPAFAAPLPAFGPAHPGFGGPGPFGPPGPGGPMPINPALLARLQPRLDTMLQAFAAGNMDAVVTIYDEKAVIYPDRDYPYFGKTGVRKLATKMRTNGITALNLQPLDVREGGSWLLLRGQFQAMKGPGVAAQGKVVQYWRDENGQLLVKYELYNMDFPETPDQIDTLGDAAVKRQVQDRLDEWSRLFEAKNIDGVSELYTETCKVFPFNDFTHNGREGARKVYQDQADTGSPKVTYRVMEATRGGNLVETWVYYEGYRNNNVYDEGTNVFVMKDVGGKLQIHYDIFNQEYVTHERDEDVKMAEQYAKEWVDLYNAGNIPAMMQLYDPEAVRVANGVPFAYGIPAIQQVRQSFHDSGITVAIQVYSAHRAGDYLIVNGRSQAMKGGVVVGEGKFLDLHKVLGGGKNTMLWDTTTNN